MMKIEHFQEEHVEILKVLKKLESLCEKNIQLFSNEIARELIMLRFKIKVHLSVEDSILYPSVDKGGDDSVLDIAHEFREQMASVSVRFMGFMNRWELATSIAANPNAFYQEVEALIGILRHRIQQENQQFYPAIARLQAADPQNPVNWH